MAAIQKITPSLWFDRNAEEAVQFYTTVFKNSKVLRTSFYTKAGQEQQRMEAGSVMTIEFSLEGQHFMALNGGPAFKFNEAVSFVVYCNTQDEIDHYWNQLSAGGDPKSQQCGWLKDRFGVSWQIVPASLPDMMASRDTQKVENAFAALMNMKKLDLAAIEAAFNIG